MNLTLDFTPAEAASALAILEGLALPYLVSFLLARLSGQGWGRWVKLGVVVAASAVAGFLTVYATGDLSRGPVSVVQALSLVSFTAVTWYENHLKPKEEAAIMKAIGAGRLYPEDQAWVDADVDWDRPLQ